MPPFASVAELDARVSILKTTHENLKETLSQITTTPCPDIRQIREVELKIQTVKKQIKTLNVAKSRGQRYRQFVNCRGQRPGPIPVTDRVARIRADDEAWFAFFADREN